MNSVLELADGFGGKCLKSYIEKEEGKSSGRGKGHG